MEVELDNGEILMATMLGLLRNSVNRAAGVVDRKKGDLDPTTMDIDGMAAEVAFCKFQNLYPDFSLNPQKLTYDCLTQDGNKVDIKQTHYLDGRLLVNTDKVKAETTHYVLVIGRVPKFRMAGYVEKEEIFRDENLTDLHGRKVYAVEQERLKKF
tara:strand:+ start:4470 stop:4934 length:465 start_codon:yes stop_codon:yes gene_type:complete